MSDYREQEAAWAAERARLAARPWWRKASDALTDFSILYRWWIGIAGATIGAAFFVVLVALLGAWLSH